MTKANDMGSGSISAPALAVGWGPLTPHELLLHLLRHLTPGAPRYNPNRLDPEYIRQRACFAQLRLVCKAWDGPALDLLRSTLLFMGGSDEDTRRNLTALDYHPQLIKSLLIVNKPVWGGRDASNDVTAEFEKKIDEKLRSCSNLRELSLTGRDFTFVSRRWPQQTCPGLASTVTSLKLVSATRKTCSLALVGLGRNLTSLEVSISDTRRGHNKGPIHVPSNMPHLSRLALKDHSGHPYAKHSPIYKILSRIVSEDGAKIPKSKKTSPLRHLSLDAYLEPHMITTILTTNSIGLGLTSFTYPMHSLRRAQLLALIIPVLKLCPRLVDFSLSPACPGEVFMHLPHTLRRFEFTVYFLPIDEDFPDQDDSWSVPNPIGAFEKYLKSQAHSLEYVHVCLQPHEPMDIDISVIAGAWRRLLKSAGISHDVRIEDENRRLWWSE